jgi:hypothetical protein
MSLSHSRLPQNTTCIGSDQVRAELFQELSLPSITILHF